MLQNAVVVDKEDMEMAKDVLDFLLSSFTTQLSSEKYTEAFQIAREINEKILDGKQYSVAMTSMLILAASGVSHGLLKGFQVTVKGDPQCPQTIIQ